MGVYEDFKTFCSNLSIPNHVRSSISQRYRRITRRLNLDFWDIDSETQHSMYVGSYGRGTAIKGFSDLDMIFWLPKEYFYRYSGYSYNGQSAMLQDVRRSLLQTYPSTEIGGDGQVVVVSFTDGITFEVVPAFLNEDGSFTYPDSNDGGRWRKTNPKPEIEAIASMDAICNGNLKRLCKMVRAWKRTWNVPMGGLLIDTLAYRFLQDWKYKEESFLYYDWMSRDFFKFLSEEPDRTYWLAVGSGQYIWGKGNFQNKAKKCYNLSLKAIEYYSNEQNWSARRVWREIYGNAFPAE